MDYRKKKYRELFRLVAYTINKTFHISRYKFLELILCSNFKKLMVIHRIT